MSNEIFVTQDGKLEIPNADPSQCNQQLVEIFILNVWSLFET